MNYRHVFHAGNFADVLKHAVMARILMHLREKPQAFRVIDTHAGAGLYDLHSAPARHTGEWRAGIARLRAAQFTPAVRALLAPYLDAVGRVNRDNALRYYPGSPLIALSLMRPQDRLLACELEPRAAAALARHLRTDARAKAIAIDGWIALNAYVPAKERRGLVLIDPPFEHKDEFLQLATGLVHAYRKWPTGIYLLWYPIKEEQQPKALVKQLEQAGIANILRMELRLDRDPARLNSAGLIIVNPPWRLAQENKRLLPELAAALAGGEPAQFLLDRPVGREQGEASFKPPHLC